MRNPNQDVTMKTLSFVLFAALPLGGCGQSVSPVGPTSSADAGRGSSVMTDSLAAAPTDATHMVRFKGNLAGSQTLTPLQPGVGAVQGSAAGTSTLLGAFTVEFPHTVTFATRSGDGTYTFVAANGDTLTATFVGQAQGGPIVSIEEHARITGGTGRFEDATGTFVVQRTFDPATGSTQGTFEGTISSVGGR